MSPASIQNAMQSRAFSGFESLPLAGQWRIGRGKRPNRDIDPYSGEVLVEIPQASLEDMDGAYAAAAKAQSAWAAKLPGERAEIMRAAARVMEARREEIVSWLIRESGSTRLKAMLEWEAVHAGMLEAAALPYLVEGRILAADVPGKESRVYRKPVGVVAVISPWNWPLHLTNRSLAPALAVGNAAVVNPALGAAGLSRNSHGKNPPELLGQQVCDRCGRLEDGSRGRHC